MSANHLPASTPVEPPPEGKRRNFVGANNSPIKNHGTASIHMCQLEGVAKGTVIGSKVHVADVSRPLASTGRICDAASSKCPDGHEVLYTQKGAIVVPHGSLSQFLGNVRKVAVYPRRGKGLYVAKMRIQVPTKPGFTRQGAAA